MKRWLLLSFVIATVVLNIFLNRFMFDSVGVVFDRSIGVRCDTSLREGRHKWTHLEEDLVCCLSSVDYWYLSHPSSTHKLSELGASCDGLWQSGLWRQLFSAHLHQGVGVSCVIYQAQCHGAESGFSALSCGDSNVGPVFSWWCTSRWWMKFLCLKGLVTNSGKNSVLRTSHGLKNS